MLSRAYEESELFQKYLKNYETIARDDLHNDIMPVYYKEAQTHKLISYCNRLNNKKILDVGAGKGLLLKKIVHNNKIAVDISIEYLRLLREDNIKVIMANAEDLPFINEFDIIFLSDILEHVFDPVKVLGGVHRALKIGGRVVIRVPFKEDLTQYKVSEGCKYEFVHLRSFTETYLFDLLRNAGFKLTKLHYDGFSVNKARNKRIYLYIIRLLGLLSLSLGRHFDTIEVNPLIRRIPWLGQMFLNLRAIYLSKYGGFETIQIDPFICNLPNWLGILFFEPIEIVVVAERV